MLIEYMCNNTDCENSIVKHFKSFKLISPFLDCGACGTGKLERQLSSPTSKSTQILDNGTQARQVEIMNEVIDKEKDRLDQE